MSRFLEDDGISSATITGETRYGARKSYIRMFRENEIQVLCNYEVLTTGFDAPKVNTIIIARPTYSRIIYQQMIGRGLRGPKFNGTEECDIINHKGHDQDKCPSASRTWIHEAQGGMWMMSHPNSLLMMT